MKSCTESSSTPGGTVVPRSSRKTGGSSLDRATVEVVTALASAGVPSILLKGPALASWLYDDPSERQYGDADLLIAPSRLPQAESVLSSLSFCGQLFTGERGGPPANVWTRELDGAAVELHCGLVGTETDGERTWQVLAPEVERLEIAGSPLPVLRPAARALVVALAAAEKGAYAEKSRRDLAAALERVPQARWREAAALAERLGATSALASGLGLVAAGALLADDLRLSAERTPAIALRAEASPDVRGAALSLAWIAEQSGWREKCRALLRLILPPAREMREAYPLSRRGRSALIVAYGWRLAVLLRRVAPAVRAYSAARRR